jgi:O-methyltransferase
VRAKVRSRLRRLLAARGYVALSFGDEQRRSDLDLVREVSEEVQLGLGYMDGVQLASAVRAAMRIPGDLAEVGVFQGGSARIICENREPGRALHLFDTFEGIPAVEPIDATHFAAGDWAAPIERAQAYLRPYEHVHFHPGVFPDTTGPVESNRFAFVGLDVDALPSTLAGLEFFFPRLNPGGILLVNDYRRAPGARKALELYFNGTRPEPVIPLPGSQALVVKSAT